MLCQKCGQQIRDGAKFCDKCGSLVNMQTHNNTPYILGNSEEDDNSLFQRILNSGLVIYPMLLFVPFIGIPYMWYFNKTYTMKKKIILTVISAIWLLFIAGITTFDKSKPHSTEPAQTKQEISIEKQPTNDVKPTIVDLNKDTNSNLPQGTEVVLEGVVELGNGTKANRTFSTGFGTANSQAIIFEINHKTIKVFLAEPSKTSLYEKKLKIRGKIDNEIKDPIGKKVNDDDIIITNAVIIN